MTKGKKTFKTETGGTRNDGGDLSGNDSNESEVFVEPGNHPTVMDAAQFQALMTSLLEVVRDSLQRPAPPATADGEADLGTGPKPSGDVGPDYSVSVNNFKRRMPSFEIGTQPFEQFCRDFQLTADQSGFDFFPKNDNPHRDEILYRRGAALKGLFYQCLSTEAKALAGRRLYPTSDECKNIKLEEYIERLRLLFEPPSESETARHEFLARRQHKEENPMLYLSDKVTLFERAFAAPRRDFNLLSDSTTDGLFNETLRKEMRKIVVSNEAQYGEKLAFHVNAIRKSVIAGDMSESDAKGTNTYSTTSSYLAQKSGTAATTIKSEPGIYALDSKKSGSGTKKNFKLKCYHCQKTGHFARECSRKLAGLPAVKRDAGRILAVVEAISASSDSEAELENEICALQQKRQVRFKKDKAAKTNRKSVRTDHKRRSVNQIETDNSESDERYDTCPGEPEGEGEGGAEHGANLTPPAAQAGVHTIEEADIIEALENDEHFLGI